MELNWGEADPNYFLGRLMGLCVSVNGTDRFVVMVDREGMDLRDWGDGASHCSNSEPQGADFRVPWDDVESLFVY